MKTTCSRPLVRIVAIAGLALNVSFRAAAADAVGESLRAGTNYIATPVYSADADTALLKLFDPGTRS